MAIAMGFEGAPKGYFDDNADGTGDAILNKAQHELRFKSDG